MTIGFLISYVASFLVCWGVSVLIERLFQPRSKPMWQRPYIIVVIHLLLLGMTYTFFLLISQRFLFSIAGALSIAIVILGVNNAKYATLKEPLVFSDFFLYLQVFQHPRLYLPFLGMAPLLALITLGGAVIFGGIALEEPAYTLVSVHTAFLFLVFFLIYYTTSRLVSRAVISLNLEVDCERFGVITTACIYAFKASKYREITYKKIAEESAFLTRSRNDDIPPLDKLADIVIIQSESFFDARELSQNVKAEVLAEYDKCLHLSRMFGKLKVPAWGANTMRSEFGFLTGLTSEQLGLAKFYPYQQLLGANVPSIISVLKSAGYHCICIHPNASSFFMRDKFFNALGFDEFIDEKFFGGVVRAGPYVADEAVTKKIMQELDKVDKPCFIFAITMENHGPLHLESVTKDEWKDYYKTHPDAGLDDLTVYLRHLKNADKMIAQLCEFFSKRKEHVLFSLYGDHVPAIPKIFERMGYDDPRSNYFIWSNHHLNNNIDACLIPQELNVERLAEYLLDLQKNLSQK